MPPRLVLIWHAQALHNVNNKSHPPTSPNPDLCNLLTSAHKTIPFTTSPCRISESSNAIIAGRACEIALMTYRSDPPQDSPNIPASAKTVVS